jgi:hypothetical protein
LYRHTRNRAIALFTFPALASANLVSAQLAMARHDGLMANNFLPPVGKAGLAGKIRALMNESP